MRPIATVVAIAVALLAVPPLAEPSGAATPEGAAAPPLTLRLDALEPNVVTASGPADLTVTGTLTNTGTSTVDDMAIRVQRGQPIGSEGDLRDALEGNAGADSVQPRFVPVPGALPPGGRLPVRLTVPLRGSPDSTLALTTPGVHELLVNVNGAPGGAPRARLAGVRMLLPVLSLPPDPAARSEGAREPPRPTPMTLLYPITDVPHRIPTVQSEPTLLDGDELATELAPEGRLGGLVAALAAAPVGSAARAATCLAIDPDLVETAIAMRDGYQVRTPDGGTVAGTGAQAAASWVEALIAQARGGCVVALPIADADLVSLNRSGLDRLAVTAQTDGRRLLAELLGTPVLDGLTWPVDAVLDEPTLARVGEAGNRAVLLTAESIGQNRGQLHSGVVPIAGHDQFAVLADPLLTAAATSPEAAGRVGGGGAVPARSLAGEVTPLSTQDSIAALAFRALSGPGRGDGSLVLAPPHQWAAEGTGAGALLRAMDTMTETGHLTPRPLAEILEAGPADGPSRQIDYPLRAGGRELPGEAADLVRGALADIDDLRSAAVPDSGVGLEPAAVLEPLTRSMLRPMSAAWRGQGDRAVEVARQSAARVAELRGTVRVLEPPSPYALGTANAPLLMTIGNGLPFTVRVRLEIASTSGLRVAPIEMQQVPPLGRRQMQVSAQVTRSGQFTVLAAVRSPAGELLGEPSRLRVRSTAYGTITVWLTASAGILLVVLAVRRVRRRVQVEPPPHTGPLPLAPTGRSGAPLERPARPLPPVAGSTPPQPNGARPSRDTGPATDTRPPKDPTPPTTPIVLGDRPIPPTTRIPRAEPPAGRARPPDHTPMRESPTPPPNR